MFCNCLCGWKNGTFTYIRHCIYISDTRDPSVSNFMERTFDEDISGEATMLSKDY